MALIYDVGPDYLVLEYLEGEPLRGILHRDLKPANVIVLRHGDTAHAKVLDFGVAQLTSSELDATSDRVPRRL